MSHLIRVMKSWISEEGGKGEVHKSMQVVVQVCHHMICSEGRRYNAVHDDVLFICDYGVQSPALHGLYGRDHVFA